MDKKATGQLPGGLLNAMAKAIKLPNGKQYNSALELFGDMVFKPFLGEITIDEQEYGEDKRSGDPIASSSGTSLSIPI